MGPCRLLQQSHLLLPNLEEDVVEDLINIELGQEEHVVPDIGPVNPESEGFRHEPVVPGGLGPEGIPRGQLVVR